MTQLICPNCGGKLFYAHQMVRMDIVVDSDNNFYENLSEDVASDIYDSEEPYGPYQCVECGTEFDVD